MVQPSLSDTQELLNPLPFTANQVFIPNPLPTVRLCTFAVYCYLSLGSHGYQGFLQRKSHVGYAVGTVFQGDFYLLFPHALWCHTTQGCF